jgi:hypothetical protein
MTSIGDIGSVVCVFLWRGVFIFFYFFVSQLTWTMVEYHPHATRMSSPLTLSTLVGTNLRAFFLHMITYELYMKIE